MSTSLAAKQKLMLSYKHLKPEQIEAIDRLYEYNHTLLIAHMGSGKTVVSLTALKELIAEGVIRKVLILAPLKVCNTVWATEYLNWEHLNDLSIAIATGTPSDRKKALQSGASIIVTNFENVPWLVQQPEMLAFDGLLVDELTKLKGGGTTFKKLRKFIPKFTWRVGMTGTLVSEDVQSIFYQAYVIDAGETFGKNKEKFLTRYFYPTDFNGYKWEPKPNAENQIVRLFNPYMHAMPDYRHTLPPLVHMTVSTPLPPPAMEIYRQMKKDMGVEGVTAENAAVLTGKLQQIASGFMYADDGSTVHIHNSKFEKLGKIYDTNLKKGGKSTMLVVYQYKEELARLRQMFPDAGVIGAGVTRQALASLVTDWNEGRLNVLLLHPKSAGHGLNLAKGGSLIVWVSPVWSRDLFDQTNARLHRRGQTRPVEVMQLIAPDTVEPLVAERVDDKAVYMQRFLSHLQAIE